MQRSVSLYQVLSLIGLASPVFPLNCFVGMVIRPAIFEPQLEMKNCSRHSIICRRTTLSYAPINGREISYTNLLCDENHKPCHLWCDFEMEVDPAVERCETHCCHGDFCNTPEIIDDPYMMSRDEPETVEVEIDEIPNIYTLDDDDVTNAGVFLQYPKLLVMTAIVLCTALYLT